MTAFGGAMDDPTRVLGSRIGAFIVDYLLVTFLVVAIFAALSAGDYTTFDAGAPGAPRCADLDGPVSGIDGAGGPTDVTCLQLGSTIYVLSDDQAQGAQTTINLLFVALTFANSVLLQSAGGATVGKRLFGLRVVVPTGRPAGIGRNTLRWLLMVVDAACCFLPGLISASKTKGHRRIGDLAAGTFVVHRSAMGRVLHIPGLITVRQKHEFGTSGPAPVRQAPTVAEGGGIDAPAWDPARNTYVRYDPAQGVWFQWDDATSSWIPVPS